MINRSIVHSKLWMVINFSVFVDDVNQKKDELIGNLLRGRQPKSVR
jgi:hypothetical protein